LSPKPPEQEDRRRGDFQRNPSGAQIAQAVGPLRRALAGESKDAVEQGDARFLLLTQEGSDAAELIQAERTSGSR
jgi:hypothetical protein